MLISGLKGHIAMLDWRKFEVIHEMELSDENIHDIT
jgi:hypothetical protein